MNLGDLKELIKQIESTEGVNDQTEIVGVFCSESGRSSSWGLGDVEMEYHSEDQPLEMYGEDASDNDHYDEDEGCIIMTNVIKLRVSGDSIGWE